MRRAFSTSIFVRHAGEILLIHHNRLQQWLPVGGEFAAGETPLECAQRELREETGLAGTFAPLGGVDGTPPGLLAYEEHGSGSKGTHLNFCFVADVATRDIKANDEFSQHRWVSAPPAECPLNVRQLVQLALGSAAGLAQRWMDAFNRHAVEDLLLLYADDAVHVTPKLRAQNPGSDGALHGKEALRAWWTGALQRSPQLRYALNHAACEGARVWMHYTRINPGEAAYPVAELLQVDEAGRICRSEVFHG